MITILAILIIWYITKLYYTHSFKINIVKSDLIDLRCASCGRPIYRSIEHIRAINYCTDCA
jgi:hypothetical protein